MFVQQLISNIWIPQHIPAQLPGPVPAPDADPFFANANAVLVPAANFQF